MRAIADAIRAVLPAYLAHQIVRGKNVALGMAFYQYCRRFPDRAKRYLIAEVAKRRTADDDERRRYYRITAFGRRVLELEVARLAHVVAIARRKQLLRPEPA